MIAGPAYSHKTQCELYFLLTFDIIEFVRVWVVDVYAEYFPVRLSIVDHGQDSQDFDLDDRPPGMNRPTYLDHVNRVVVTTNASAAINVARVLPSLSKKIHLLYGF